MPTHLSQDQTTDQSQETLELKLAPAEHAKIPELTSLKNLLSAPQGIENKENADLLEKAGIEIIEKLRIPIISIQSKLADARTKHTEKVKDYETAIAQGLAALEFLDYFCLGLKGRGVDDDVIFTIESDFQIIDNKRREVDGVRIIVTPKNSESKLGDIGSDKIQKVEIVVRHRDPDSLTKQIYTPMQLNFRFLGEGDTEVRSLRIDLHTRDKRLVEVDAEVGGTLLAKNHQTVKALSGDKAEENFELLQQAFILNLMDTVVLSGETSQDGTVVPRAGIEFSPAKKGLTGKKAIKIYARAERALRPHSVTASEEQDSEKAASEETPAKQTSKFEAAVQTINETTLEYLKKALIDSIRKRENLERLSSTEILLIWLFELPETVIEEGIPPELLQIAEELSSGIIDMQNTPELQTPNDSIIQYAEELYLQESAENDAVFDTLEKLKTFKYIVKTAYPELFSNKTQT